MKVLITGGSGLVGQYLNRELSKQYEILSLYNNKRGNCKDYNSVKVDITDFDKLNKIYTEFKPDTVIHTAAITSVQQASSLPAKIVNKTNVEATKFLSELCERNNAKLIYISTDLVYAGYRGSLLDESKKLIPVSLYAETKLMGEEKIKQTFDNFLIIRMALTFGFGFYHSRNHFHNTYNSLKKNKQVKLFTDQFRSTISLFEVARILDELTKLDVKNEIINVGGPERISRYEMGKMLCEFAGFDKNLLEKITMGDIPDLPEVEDVSLNIDKLKSYGINLKSLPEALREVLDKKEDVFKTN